MARWLFNFVAAMSLAVATVACVAWWRSFDGSDRVTWARPDGTRWLRSAQGHFVLRVYDHVYPNREPLGWSYRRDEAMPPAWELMAVYLLCSDASSRVTQWERAGFAWTSRQSSRDLIVTAVAPCWAVAGTAGLLPAAWTVSRMRRRGHRQARRGLCATCGYDLRATPTRCPECGTVPNVAPPTPGSKP